MLLFCPKYLAKKKKYIETMEGASFDDNDGFGGGWGDFHLIGISSFTGAAKIRSVTGVVFEDHFNCEGCGMVVGGCTNGQFGVRQPAPK